MIYKTRDFTILEYSAVVLSVCCNLAVLPPLAGLGEPGGGRGATEGTGYTVSLEPTNKQQPQTVKISLSVTH